MAPVTATLFYGIGQVGIFDAVQNYYIDAFERYAASAIAAGSLFRSVVGGVVPVFTGGLLESVGLGQGFSVFFWVCEFGIRAESCFVLLIGEDVEGEV